MADECTDITAMEELSVFCCRDEEGTPVECFLDIEPLKEADAGSIYLPLVKCIKDKKLQVGKKFISKFTSIAAIIYWIILHH